MPVKVVKATGEVADFDEAKVANSIRRAGIPDGLQQAVLRHVKDRLYNEISTAEIYHHISEFLGKSSVPFAKSRYSLKQAIMLLGPTGYPFEDFVAKLLEALGYDTKVRQILNGACITHEIDIIAHKHGLTAMIEAKFHNSPGTRSEVHVPMYTKARFDDIKDRYGLDQAWVVTNTKTTKDANAFAQCANMRVISWSYPEGEGLRDLIEQSGLHPITMITTLTLSQKMKLLEDHLTLCKDLWDNKSRLDTLDMTEEQKKRTLEELAFVCNTEPAITASVDNFSGQSPLQPPV